MTVNSTFEDCIAIGFQENEENKFAEQATNAIKSNLVSYCSTTKENSEPESEADYEKILNLTALSIKMFANSHYKPSAYLEPNEIEQIKISLNNYTNCHEKIDVFKKEIIDDLTEFQKQIKTNHIQKIVDLTKEKQLCEKQIRVLDCEKHKLIAERLSKIVWPYDEKTKEYDNKISKLQLQIQKYTNKIEDIQKMRPAANEKDILMYRIHFKEKFARKT